MKKISEISYIIFITLLTIFRFYKIDADAPWNLSWSGSLLTDEGWYAASAIRKYFGFDWIKTGDLNAYSLMPAGEWVKYLVILIFGKSLQTVRLATAFCSTFSIFTIFLILKKCKLRHKHALMGSLLLSSSYTFFFFSRLSNTNEIIGTFFLLLSLYFFFNLIQLNNEFNFKILSNIFFTALFASLCILVKTSFIGILFALTFLITIFSLNFKNIFVKPLIFLGFLSLIFTLYWILIGRFNFEEMQYFASISYGFERIYPDIGFLKRIAIYIRDLIRFPINLFRADSIIFLIFSYSLFFNIKNNFHFFKKNYMQKKNYFLNLINKKNLKFKYSLSIIVISLSLIIPFIIGGGYTPKRYFVPFIPLMVIYICIFAENQEMLYFKQGHNKFNQMVFIKKNIFSLIFILYFVFSSFFIGYQMANLTFTKKNSWLEISRKIEQNYNGKREKPILVGKFADDVNIVSSKIDPYNIGMSPIYSSNYLSILKPDYLITDRFIKKDLSCKDYLFFNESDDLSELCLAGLKDFDYLSYWTVYPRTYVNKEIKLFKLNW